MSCLSGDSHWVVIYYIGLGWLYEKWTLNDLNKNNQFGRNLVFSKWCRGGLKWIWDGFKGIKMAVCCIFNVCSLLIQFYEENWWAVDYGICYNPDVASESGLCSNYLKKIIVESIVLKIYEGRLIGYSGCYLNISSTTFVEKKDALKIFFQLWNDFLNLEVLGSRVTSSIIWLTNFYLFIIEKNH
uniref:Uncharacterized protein n=1 Tax=Helianthus annuus TaxID=4232 RepID=A0A251SPC4_HELAN